MDLLLLTSSSWRKSHLEPLLRIGQIIELIDRAGLRASHERPEAPEEMGRRVEGLHFLVERTGLLLSVVVTILGAGGGRPDVL